LWISFSRSGDSPEGLAVQCLDSRTIGQCHLGGTDEGPVLEGHADSGASRTAEHFAGQAILVRLQDPRRRISVAWRAILRDGSNYVRQEITMSPPDDDQPIAEVHLFEGSLPGASVIGSVKGSPVTSGEFFLGFEDPLAQCQTVATVTCNMKRELPLRKG
jgi:hypothetical protein